MTEHEFEGSNANFEGISMLATSCIFSSKIFAIDLTNYSKKNNNSISDDYGNKNINIILSGTDFMTIFFLNTIRLGIIYSTKPEVKRKLYFI